MTDQQSEAIANPCELAEQCCNRRYFTATDTGPFLVSVGLTVNVGQE